MKPPLFGFEQLEFKEIVLQDLPRKSLYRQEGISERRKRWSIFP